MVRSCSKRFPAMALHVYCHVEETRSGRRQTKTWMENMRQDLAEKVMDLRTALDNTRAKKKWIHLIRFLEGALYKCSGMNESCNLRPRRRNAPDGRKKRQRRKYYISVGLVDCINNNYWMY